jgi:hypothetical protein
MGTRKDMAVFDAPMVVTFEPDGMHAKLHEDFFRTSAYYGIIVIPAGFETDFASIPRVFWNILPPIGQYLEAAVVHDYLYSMGTDLFMSADRKTADLVFLELMERSGVPIFRRHVIYRAVRLFGRWAWKNHERERVKK